MTGTIRTIAGIAVLAGVCMSGLVGCGDTDVTVERPSTKDAQTLVDQLAAAYRVQDVCYGWVFQPRDGDSFGQDPPEVGSNFGVDEPVDAHDCARTVELHVNVTYTAMSSEMEDSASFVVNATGDLPPALGSDIDIALRERFGLTEAALIDDPVGALGRAVLALPLLVAEQEVAPPAPTPTATGDAVEPLSGGGSDFWRSQWGSLLTVLVMLLVAGVLMVAGLRARTGPERRSAARGRPARRS